MSHLSRSWFAFWLCVLPVAALACLWDYDTLQQERARYPTTLELITGKFLRHSPEFYAWRIQDRLLKLKKEPENLALYDDLAVAYEETGQHTLALETIRKKDELKPNLYETLSNHGTFHILAGDFEEGLPLIERALEINPDAHFGREKYQKWLVEYALERRRDGKIVFPLRWDPTLEKEENVRQPGFQQFLVRAQHGADAKQKLTDAELQEAIRGVQGMMRFANHANPLLLEALGDLLLVDTLDMRDAKQLAARCYLKAAYEAPDLEAKHAYRELAKHALKMQHRGGRDMPLEQEFAEELAEAEEWYADLKAREVRWIREGRDVEEEFAKLYAEPPSISERVASALPGIFCVVGWLATALAPFLFFWLYRRRKARFRPVKEFA